MMEPQFEPRSIDPIPQPITSPEAKLVYLFVDAAGPATVEDLNETLAMKKIAILSVLNELTGRGFVVATDDGYVTTR